MPSGTIRLPTDSNPDGNQPYLKMRSFSGAKVAKNAKNCT